MVYLYNTLFYQPILNAFVWLYENISFGDLGIAIVLLTLVIRIILYPLFHKTTKHQLILRKIQPKIDEIRKEHKEDALKQYQLLKELYNEHGVGPYTSLGLTLLQLPILIALYQIMRNIFVAGALEGKLYAFITPPAAFSPLFLGLINLQEKNIVIVVLAALAQYWQGKLSLPAAPSNKKDADFSEGVARMMVFVGPLMTLLVLWNFPAAVGVYWIASSLFTILQQKITHYHIEHEDLARIRTRTS